MRALVFRPAQDEIRFDDVTIDAPVAGEVLVNVMAAGLCHSDVHFMQSRTTKTAVGLYGNPLRASVQPGMAARRQAEQVAEMLVMGHEPAGVVEAVGPDVISIQPGDRVIGCGISNCGHCAQCLLGRPHLCLMLPRRSPSMTPRLQYEGQPIQQFANIGAFGEQILVHQSSLARIPADIPFASASILGCSIATGTGAVLNTAGVTPGSSVAVFGTGGIGLSIVQGARICGAAQIFAVDLLETKLAMARTFGATEVINAAEVDPLETIFELTQGRGTDYNFDTTAVPAAAQQAYDSLGLRGTLTCLAGPPATLSNLTATERRVQGSHFGSTRVAVDIPRYVDLYRQGRLLLDEMITLRVEPESLDGAIGALEAGTVACAVVKFGADI